MNFISRRFCIWILALDSFAAGGDVALVLNNIFADRNVLVDVAVDVLILTAASHIRIVDLLFLFLLLLSVLIL